VLGIAVLTATGRSIRLHHARLVMMMVIRNRLTAAAAAPRVGSESPSQFNRHFKRFRSPKRGSALHEGPVLAASTSAARSTGDQA
jgi:hypothetical protein